MVIFFPFISLLLSSFAPAWRFGDLIPNGMNLSYYKDILSNQQTYMALITSLIIAYGATALNLIVGIPAARFLARTKSKLKFIVYVFLLAPLVVPPLISTLGIHFELVKLGLSGNFLSVILVHMVPTLPYVILALHGAFKTFPKAVEEAALLDGSEGLNLYKYVILPLIKPGIVIGSIFSIIISFSEYILTMLVGGGVILSYPILMFPYLNSGDGGIASAHAIIFCILNIFAIVIFELLIGIALKKITRVNRR